MKNRYVVVFDDMVIAVPQHAREFLDDYTNNRSTTYLQLFLKGEPLTIKQRVAKILPTKVKRFLKKIMA